MKNKITIAVSAISLGLASSFSFAEVATQTGEETKTEIKHQKAHLDKVSIDGEALIRSMVETMMKAESIEVEDFYQMYIDFVDNKINLNLSEDQTENIIDLIAEQNESISQGLVGSHEEMLKITENFEKAIMKVLDERQTKIVENIHSIEVKLFENTFEINRDDQLIINGNTIDLDFEKIEAMSEEEAKEHLELITSYVDVEAMRTAGTEFIQEIMMKMQ